MLVRPSYVLGGQGMQIAVSDEDVVEFMNIINRIKQDHPILVDKYLMGKEIEVDAVCDGQDILIPGIMEHIERAGIHSGDSISVYPAKSISPKIVDMIEDYTGRLARALHVKGMINIQFIVYNDQVYVIEVTLVQAVQYHTSARLQVFQLSSLLHRLLLARQLRN